MNYGVSFADDHDFSITHTYVSDSPQGAAIAERTYIFDDCLRLESYEYFDRCYKNDEPDRCSLLVLSEDGGAWIVEVESWPTTYDLKRKQQIIWKHVVTSCELKNVRFRWHDFTADDTDDRNSDEYPYGAVHHVCDDQGEPCGACAELDATITARRVNQ